MMVGGSWFILCLVASALAEMPNCTRYVDSVSPSVTRLTCDGPYFNFSKVSFTANKIFVGGTNFLFHLDSNMKIAEQVNVADPGLRSACKTECDRCMKEAKTQSLLGFCRNDGSTECLPHFRPLCENWVNLIQPVTDLNNKEYLLTCGTASMFRNVSNCQIRSTSNLSNIMDNFQATLTVSSQRPSSFLSFGTSAAVSTSGKLSSQFYTAGHIPFEGLFFKTPFTFGYLHNFDYLQLDVLQRSHSRLMKPPRADFDLTWYSSFGSKSQVNGDANTGQFTHYHLQYIFEGYVYIWASGVGLTDKGTRTPGSYIWRYCVDDHQNATYLASLRRIRVACTGVSKLRDYVSRNTKPATGHWEMNQMTSAIEVKEAQLGDNNGPYVVASFTTLDPMPMSSSICAYNKQAVRDSFNNNPGRNFKVKPCDRHYSGSYGGCMSTYTEEFIKNYTNVDVTLTQDCMYPLNQLPTKCTDPLWMRNHIRISDITYGHYSQSYYIFATTRDGQVFRLASPHPDGTARDGLVFTLINELRVGEFDGDAEVEVAEIEFLHTIPATVAVVTRRSVTSLPTTDCEQYSVNCSSCLGLQASNIYNRSVDPSCVWCKSSRTCVVRGKSTCRSSEYPALDHLGRVDCSLYPRWDKYNDCVAGTHTCSRHPSVQCIDTKQNFSCECTSKHPYPIADLYTPTGQCSEKIDYECDGKKYFVIATTTTYSRATELCQLYNAHIAAADGPGKKLCINKFSSSSALTPFFNNTGPTFFWSLEDKDKNSPTVKGVMCNSTKPYKKSECARETYFMTTFHDNVNNAKQVCMQQNAILARPAYKEHEDCIKTYVVTLANENNWKNIQVWLDVHDFSNKYLTMTSQGRSMQSQDNQLGVMCQANKNICDHAQKCSQHDTVRCVNKGSTFRCECRFLSQIARGNLHQTDGLCIEKNIGRFDCDGKNYIVIPIRATYSEATDVCTRYNAAIAAANGPGKTYCIKKIINDGSYRDSTLAYWLYSPTTAGGPSSISITPNPGAVTRVTGSSWLDTNYILCDGTKPYQKNTCFGVTYFMTTFHMTFDKAKKECENQRAILPRYTHHSHIYCIRKYLNELSAVRKWPTIQVWVNKHHYGNNYRTVTVNGLNSQNKNTVRGVMCESTVYT